MPHKLSFWLLLGLLLIPASTLAQEAAKRPLTHDDYDAWKSLRSQTISRDGRWVSFVASPQVGDGELIVRETAGPKEYRYLRGSRPSFTPDGRFLVFTINAAHRKQIAYELSQLSKSGSSRSGRFGRRGRRPRPEGPKTEGKGSKKKAPKKPERPKSRLAVMNLHDGKVEIIEGVKSHRVPSEGSSVLIYHLEKDPEAKKAKEAEKPAKKEGATEKGSPESQPSKEQKAEKAPASRSSGTRSRPGPRGRRGRRKPSGEETKKTPPYLSDGTPLVILDLGTTKKEVIEGVTSFGLTRKGEYLWFSCNSKKENPKIERGFFAMDLGTRKRTSVLKGASSVSSVSTDRELRRFVFLSNLREREKEKSNPDLYSWSMGEEPAKMIVCATRTEGFPVGHRLKGSSGGGRRFGRFGRFGGGGLSFSKDASVLLLSASPLPKKELPKLRSSDRVTLDIWNWKDPVLQPMQAKRRGGGSLRCAWHFDEERLVVLSAKTTDSVSFLTPDGSRALLRDSLPYAKAISWDTGYSDVSVVNTMTGARRRLLTHLRGRAQASLGGRYVLVFDGKDWLATDVQSGSTRNLSENIPTSFAIEDWDTPQPSRSYGIAGWTEDDRAVLINDRTDIWMLPLDGSKAICVTDGYGRAQNLSFRYTRLDPEERFIPSETPLLLAATNLETMASGYYQDRLDAIQKPHRLLMRDQRVSGLRKAKNSERLFLTLGSFEEYPNLWTCDAKFENLLRLSDINPQQKEFRWGKAEMVHWRSADGVPLKGFLIKPDDFDPSKKYPMMVYFYEKTSSGIHSYRSPTPGTSPNPSYYVSNGYLWFQPDIVYKEGYPGASCLKCVVPGVQSLIAKGFVQEDAIGAAGHSWGGYQTAYLVTQTNIFKAVESGAPVSNMTSAYGGIRWGSGMSRAFQYERTQSRIGDTLWARPLRYLENSPVFYADKVETPILMIHNDEDGAVPWYQGIEYFCALRRLGKEAYLLNYNGQGHGLRRRADQRDWTKRMQQYFDHHLKGSEMPRWMASGVPFADREREKIEFTPPKHFVPAKPVKTPAGESPAAILEK